MEEVEHQRAIMKDQRIDELTAGVDGMPGASHAELVELLWVRWSNQRPQAQLAVLHIEVQRLGPCWH